MLFRLWKKPSTIRVNRRNVARMLTVLNQRNKASKITLLHGRKKFKKRKNWCCKK